MIHVCMKVMAQMQSKEAALALATWKEGVLAYREVRRQAERMRGEHSHGKAPQPSLPLCPRASKLKG